LIAAKGAVLKIAVTQIGPGFPVTQMVACARAPGAGAQTTTQKKPWTPPREPPQTQPPPFATNFPTCEPMTIDLAWGAVTDNRAPAVRISRLSFAGGVAVVVGDGLVVVVGSVGVGDVDVVEG